VGAVCVEAPVRFCAGAISDDRPYRVTYEENSSCDVYRIVNSLVHPRNNPLVLVKNGVYT
jgi:hypothetical protein